jgi:cyclopropane fatty-acyl-phospholipid synthase-like methyltransferase
LSKELIDARIVANESEPALIRLAQQRLSGTSVELFSQSFLEWHEPLDVVVSWGSHHHLTPAYLDHVRHVLTPGGLFLIGDEFCPEYCFGDDLARIQDAEVIAICDGYVLTSHDEVSEYTKARTIPHAAIECEKRRQQALWAWYKYVVDIAFTRQNMTVAIAELHIAANDISTAFAEEHKLAPSIVERDLELRGFRMRSKHNLAPNRASRLQSFIIYEYTANS